LAEPAEADAMRSLVILFLLAGCATPLACKRVAVSETKTETVVVNHYVVVHDHPAHTILLSDYEHVLSAEKPLVMHSKAPTIDRLIVLDTAARKAFAPIQNPHHHATAAEISSALTALGALQVYVTTQKH
jgi:hypothetical protein